MSAFEDVMTTPIISTTIPEFIPIDTDATPYIVNGRISETYDKLPSLISAPIVPNLPINQSGSSPVLKTRLWKNQLYAKRITRNEKFKELHKNVFPELSHHQMVFVYFNYYTTKSTHYDTTAEFENWDAPENIKHIVQTRIAQQILFDH